jgi:hypothetical protein
LRFHLIPVRVSIIKDGWGTLTCCWRECKLVWPLQKSVWRFIKKLLYHSAIPLLGIYTKDSMQERYLWIAALFTIAKLWNQSRCPLANEWMKKMWNTYTMEYYSVMKDKIMSFAGKWVELEIILLYEISLTEKDKYHILSTYVKTRPKKMNDTNIKWGDGLGVGTRRREEGKGEGKGGWIWSNYFIRVEIE